MVVRGNHDSELPMDGVFSYKLANKLDIMGEKNCDNCRRFGTIECPESKLCYSTENKPFYEQKKIEVFERTLWTFAIILAAILAVLCGILIESILI